MKTIISGSRSITNPQHIIDAVKASGFEITEVVSGGARGVDTMGEDWALKNKINVQTFIPRWEVGKWAGLARNKDMANYAEACIVIWSGKSPGSRNMIKTAHDKGLKVYVHLIKEETDE